MLKVQNLSISFGGNNVFENVNFIVNDGEKVGLIGRNGSGKSTLFKILCGKIKDYEGEVVVPKSYKIGYLEQHLHFTEKSVIDEACLALPEYKCDAFWDAEKVLTELGFSEEDKQKSPAEFSGGWQIRLNLAKLLISEPDVLLLDEPTNYLDILSIRWLKKFLKNYRGAIILITHDRSFMDDIIGSTIMLHRGSTIKITGNTQDMYEKIATDEETYEKTRVNDARKREQSQRFIDRFRYKATLASRVQSRIKMLEKQEVKDELADIQNLEFEFKYKDFIGNSNMLEVEDLEFGYETSNSPLEGESKQQSCFGGGLDVNFVPPPEKSLLKLDFSGSPSRGERVTLLIHGLSFKVEKGDKICVIGKNGKGKSTLLRLITGSLAALGGKVRLNPKTEIGYFGQTNINTLNPENTIEQELQNVDKLIPKAKIMNVAGIMMFSGDLAQKKISMLSGGEKSRVLLGKILLNTCNLLILDEPTNHLDMESCESLAEALAVFKGASIIVSHNEYFLNNIANKLIVFDGGKVFLFEGNYADFLRKIGWQSEEPRAEKKLEKQIKSIPCPFPNNKKEKEKLENLIIGKEIELEELLEKQDYAVYGVLRKEVDGLMGKLDDLNK